MGRTTKKMNTVLVVNKYVTVEVKVEIEVAVSL